LVGIDMMTWYWKLFWDWRNPMGLAMHPLPTTLRYLVSMNNMLCLQYWFISLQLPQVEGFPMPFESSVAWPWSFHIIPTSSWKDRNLHRNVPTAIEPLDVWKTEVYIGLNKWKIWADMLWDLLMGCCFQWMSKNCAIKWRELNHEIYWGWCVIKERHPVPSNFRRLLTTKLKSLALSGKLVKVRFLKLSSALWIN
jgi:hypothetical protein